MSRKGGFSRKHVSSIARATQVFRTLAYAFSWSPARLHRSLGILTVLMLSCHTMAVASDDYELSEVRKIVEANFQSIHDLKVEVDAYRPILTWADAARPRMKKIVWAFTDEGKVFLSTTSSFAVGQEALDPSQIVVFDSHHFKVLHLTDAQSPHMGILLPSDDALEELVRDGVYQSRCGQFWGKLLDGRSLSEWLGEDDARIVREDLVGDTECIVVEVAWRSPGGSPGQNDIERLFLAKDYNFALVRCESVRNGIKRRTCTATDLREITPGIWFPFAGIDDPHGRRQPDGTVLQPYSFKVTKVEANTDLPDSLFEIEFPLGLEVIDARFKGLVRYVWKDGLDPNDPQWIAEMEEKEGKAFKVPAAVGKKVPELDVAGWVSLEPITLASLYGKTVVLAFWGSADESSGKVVKTLNAVAEKHPDVAIIAVHAADGEQDALRELAEKENVRFRVAIDKPSSGTYPGATFEKYKVSKPPSVYIIGADGTVKFQDLPLAVVEEAVERVIEE